MESTLLRATSLRSNRKKRKNNMNMNFRNQLVEDINLIQQKWGHLSNNLKKPEYAFNYWILNRLYNIEEEIIPTLITEYNDKAIDCYVYYEDSKELYIIQNKYYDESTPLDRKLVTDFLRTPLQSLNENRYTKSPELQKIFNTIKEDPEHKIFLHFYLSNEKRNLESDSAIKSFNAVPPIKIDPLLNAHLFDLDDINKMYYGHAFKENPFFKFTLSTKVRGNTLRILPKEYDMPEMSTAYYMLTPVAHLYYMYKESKDKKYPLFEENIREYLGKSLINKGIINTLQDKKDRSNFFYYNNGVTIICKKVDTPTKHSITIHKPQIINGCQTVSSVYEVLSTYTDQQISDEFSQVFVMVKILLFEDIKPTFYRDIVKYTNKQNSINENAFGAKNELFANIQKGLKERGFLLLVKPSDKNTFISEHSSDAEINRLFKEANKFSAKIGVELKSLSDLFIPLERLLQVYLAFVKDGFYAYTKKDAVLKERSEIYSDYSLKINHFLSFENIIRLWLIYLKAERDRAEKSTDQRTPIPYYLIGFLGYFIKNKEKNNLIIERLFEEDNKIFPLLYNYLSQLTNQYKKNYISKYEIDYNTMIKKPIDEPLLVKQIETANDFISDPDLKKFFTSLY